MSRWEPWKEGSTLPPLVSGLGPATRPFSRRRVRAALVGWAVLACIGCGPVEYLNQVSGRAAAALAQAKRLGADTHAPYEYTAAAAYLHKAREEAGHSSYQVAIEYGRRAEELANRAESIARDKKSRNQSAEDATSEPKRAAGVERP